MTSVLRQAGHYSSGGLLTTLAIRLQTRVTFYHHLPRWHCPFSEIGTSELSQIRNPALVGYVKAHLIKDFGSGSPGKPSKKPWDGTLPGFFGVTVIAWLFSIARNILIGGPLDWGALLQRNRKLPVQQVITNVSTRQSPMKGGGGVESRCRTRDCQCSCEQWTAEEGSLSGPFRVGCALVTFSGLSYYQMTHTLNFIRNCLWFYLPSSVVSDIS